MAWDTDTSNLVEKTVVPSNGDSKTKIAILLPHQGRLGMEEVEHDGVDGNGIRREENAVRIVVAECPPQPGHAHVVGRVTEESVSDDQHGALPE